MQTKINKLDSLFIKEIIKKLVKDGMRQRAPKFMFYIAENGDKYRVKIPSDIKNELLS